MKKFLYFTSLFLFLIIVFLLVKCSDNNDDKAVKIDKEKIAKNSDTTNINNHQALNSVEDTSNSDYNVAIETTLQHDTNMFHQPDEAIIGGSFHKQRPMIIYKKRLYTRRPSKFGFGKYEYWINDASIFNWRFITDIPNWQVGDTVTISIKRKR